MGVKYTFAALLLLVYVASANTQETNRCEYMVEIPRPPVAPEYPELDFDGVPWSERPLLPPPEREEVCMGEYYPPATSSASGQQIIYMEEEIEGDVIIARLNYQGVTTPVIVLPLISGDFSMLLPVIRRIEGDEDLVDGWYLVITQRQDFETPGMQLYQFNVRITGESLSAGVSLVIVNIDDNAPIIQALEPCSIPELGEERLTECTYEVRDIDGQISTRFMTFAVVSQRNDSEVFYMHGENIPNEWIRMHMTVGIKRPLDFAQNQLHIFTVQAFDSLPNNASVTMLINVVNVEHRPPRWLENFAVQQFDEKTQQQFTVRAIDGDTDINKAMTYSLISDEEDTFFSIETVGDGHQGGILYVDRIDRDKLEKELFQLTIVAQKFDNASYYVETNVVIIVNDINDQRPLPLVEEWGGREGGENVYRTSILEETPLTLDFGDNFGFHDRDLGENARYSVELRDVYPPGAAAAFYVAPQEGYQRQTFFMGTLNHSMLDFEVPEFQNIVLEFLAIDLNRTDFTGTATLYIDLVNWNDEEPIFEYSNYAVSFNETVGAGFHVATVHATDRDVGDRVEHTLMGNAVDTLRIDKDTGEIFVDIDEAFDYHRQNVLFVQVRADDTLGTGNHHTTTTQLVINLQDVNNVPPTLRLPRASPSVEENVPIGHMIEDTIRATDPDTTAHLVFEINWNGTWATKQGRPTNELEFLNCVEIRTIYDDEDNKGSARGVIEAREVRHNVTIDFEEFEVLYLSVRVRDLNTVYGDDYDEAIFTINIIDMNDNAPIFARGTLQQTFMVREGSATDVVIGSVLATDIDGPLYNNVHYSIVPRNNTPEGLVTINLESGQITVDANGAIDADVPPRYHLYYTVVASDRCLEEECPPDPTYWDTPGDIEIEIIDTNNKIPYAEKEQFDLVYYVWENATSGDEITTLFAGDLDRDELYNIVRYQINYAWNPRLRSFFEVDLDSGLLYVNYTTDAVLDRDRGEPTHTIPIALIDNFYTAGDGRRNQNDDLSIEIILVDVNDNAPEYVEDYSWSISEGLLEGVLVDPEIFAHDIDDPETDNARVGYAVLGMNASREMDLPTLFDTVLIEHSEGNRARLITFADLRGYWGTHDIQIRAFDHGNPPLWTDAWFPMEIRPFNYHDPVFQFPIHQTTVRLARERATANSVLVTASGDILERIHATDEDGLHAGRVTFTVVGNAEAAEYFDVTNDGENLASLILRQAVPEDIVEFQITIRATDGGTEPGPRFVDSTLRALLVPTLGEPIFAQGTQTVLFTEGPTGLQESHVLRQAEDPKNYGCEDDCNSIYYRIVGGNTGGFFVLDARENRLRLLRALSQEESLTHTIIIAASTLESATGVPLDSSTLTVTINVIEEDPRPVFERSLYTAGISTLDVIQREILTVHASHSVGLPITYTIDHSSMEVDQSLAAVQGSAFVLHPSSGMLTLNIQPTASMHGMFEFNVVATDTENNVDTAQVKIYLISTLNRVYFLFYNTVDKVEDSRAFITTTFSTAFRMTCNIDQVVPATDNSGAALDDSTEVRAHFIRDDVPVPAEEIEALRSDTILLNQIQDRLNEQELVLQDLVTGASPDAADPNQTAVYVLAAIAALLAFLCLVLLFTFIFRTRSLNRRLEALSTTKYGSVDSGLNRVGLAPGTNKHAVEGSNPIWNEAIKAPDFDTISDTSNDSDLIGIEDMPQFRGDYFPPGDSNSLDNFMINQPTSSVASHGNNFGFNASPFSPEFANKPLRR